MNKLLRHMLPLSLRVRFLLATAAVGDRAELDLMREGSRSTVTVTMAEAP